MQSKDFSPNQETSEVPTARVLPTLHYQLIMDEHREAYNRPRYHHSASVSPNWDPLAVYGHYQTHHVSPPTSSISRSRSNPHLNVESQGFLRHYPSVPSQLNRPVSQERELTPPSRSSHYSSVPSQLNHPVGQEREFVPPTNSSYYRNPSYSLAPVLEHHCPCLGSPEYLASYGGQRISNSSSDSNHSPREKAEIMMYKIQLKDRGQRIRELEKQLILKDEYLQNLPTQNEMEKLQRQCDKFELEKEQCSNQIKQFKRLLQNAKEDIKTKDVRIVTLEQRNATFRAKIELATQGIQQNLNVDQEIRAERDHLLMDLKLVKKELEKKDHSLQALRVQSDREIKDLTEKMDNDKHLEETLKKEMLYKEDTISVLKTRLRESDAKKEQLLEENVSLQERAKEYHQVLCQSEERYVLEKKLLKELRRGVLELKGLAEIVADLTKGNDPNISTILGPAVNFSLEPKKDPVSKNSITKDIEEAIEIKNTLCELREKASENYAEYLGDKLWCATQ